MINNNTHSELEKKVELLESILKSVNEGYWEWDIKTNKLIFNPTWYTLLNYEPYELLQSFETFGTLLHPDDKEKTLKILNSYINQNVNSYEVEFRMIKKSGEICWILSRGNIERNDDGKPFRMVGTHIDITDYKVSEERVKYLNSILLAIRDINQLIVTEKDKNVLLTKSCEILSETRGFNLVWIGEIEKNNYKVISKAFSGSYTAFSDLINVTWDDSPTGQGPTGEAIKTIKTCIVNNISNDSHFKPWMDAVNKYGFNSAIALPLTDDDKIFGNLTIYSTRLNAFDNEEVSLLKEVTADISFAIHALKLEEERKKAEKRKQKLIEELQQFTEELHVSNEELQANTEELQVSNEELRQQGDELIKLNNVLHSSEERFKALIYNSTDIIRILDKDGLIVFDSASSSRILGYPEGSLIGKSPLEFIHPDDREKVKNDLKDVNKEKNSGIPTEFRTCKADGTYLPVESIAQNLIDVPGIKGIVVNTHPIKDRKKLEEHLIQTNRSLKMLGDCNKSLIRAKDEKELLKRICDIIIEKGDYTFVWVGFPDENGKILHPVAFAGKEGGYLESINVSWDNAKYGKGPGGNAYRNRKEFIINNLSLDENFAPWRDEALKRDYASVISLPLFNKGNIVGIISIYSSEKDRFDDEEVELLRELADDLAYGIISLRSDIERKRVENELEESERKYRTLFDNAGDGILIMNRDKIIDCNSKALEIYGATKKELIGETPYELFAPEYQSDQELSQEKALKHINNALKGDQQLFEWKYKHLDGTISYAEVSLNRLKIGSEYYLMAILRDITERKKDEKSLKESEAKLKIAMDMAKLVHWEYDVKSDMFTFDDQFYTLYGTTTDECGSQMSFSDYVEKFLTSESSFVVTEELTKSLETDDPHYSNQIDQTIIRADGEKRFIATNYRITKDSKGNTIKIYGANQDITERKKIEKSLKESENRYRKLLENSFDAVVIHDGYEIISANTIAMELLGVKNLEEFYDKPLLDFIHPDYHKIATKRVQKMLEKGEILPPVEQKFLQTDGTSIDVEVLAVGFVYKGEKAVQVVFRDISHRKKVENEIKTSLEEKEVLLKEIHHRVKNNLQIISSLLDLQANYVDDMEAINVLHESQNRVKSMAMIHEMLYQSNNLYSIEFSGYIRNLVQDLLYSYGTNNIRFAINIEQIFLNIETAIPCGLIISELVSNSLKYAFPDNNVGEIFVNLRSHGEEFELIISDNGIGFPEDLNFKDIQSSLGLQLVNMLINQLDGSIKLDRTQGTMFKIKFKELNYKKRF